MASHVVEAISWSLRVKCYHIGETGTVFQFGDRSLTYSPACTRRQWTETTTTTSTTTCSAGHLHTFTTTTFGRAGRTRLDHDHNHSQCGSPPLIHKHNRLQAASHASRPRPRPLGLRVTSTHSQPRPRSRPLLRPLCLWRSTTIHLLRHPFSIVAYPVLLSSKVVLPFPPSLRCPRAPEPPIQMIYPPPHLPPPPLPASPPSPPPPPAHKPIRFGNSKSNFSILHSNDATKPNQNCNLISELTISKITNITVSSSHVSD